jgi:hypothetical protein
VSPTAPTPRVDSRAVIADLLAIWDADAMEKATVRTDLANHMTPILIRGLTAHAVDSARAVLTLYRASQPVAAVPIVRAVMEDALTAAWLLAEPDASQSFVSAGAMSRAVALRAILRRGAGEDHAAIAARLEQSRELVEQLGTPSGHTIEQRFQSPDGGDGGLYLAYRLASQLSHASPSIVDMYIGSDECAPQGVYLRRHAAHDTAAMWITHTATNLLHALTVWDICRAGRPDQAALEAIGDRFGMRTEYPVATRSTEG